MEMMDFMLCCLLQPGNFDKLIQRELKGSPPILVRPGSGFPSASTKNPFTRLREA